MLDSGYWILDPGYTMLETKAKKKVEEMISRTGEMMPAERRPRIG
jgi:hypothetical protein